MNIRLPYMNNSINCLMILILASWVQTRLRPIDCFQDVKVLSRGPLGAMDPESEVSDHLKNLKPEKIVL